MFFILDMRAATVAGAVIPGHLLKGSLLDLQTLPKVTFLVHGFNVNQADGQNHLEKFAGMLSDVGTDEAAVAAVAVLWPGDSFLGPISYPFESTKADDSAAELAKFIGDQLPQRPRISFIAHSLGSRVTMKTVSLLQNWGIAVDQVCLMAAAIDNDSLASSSEYRNATEYAARVAVLYSTKDTVLRFAYPAGNLLQSFIHWNSTTDAALGLSGPRPRFSPYQDIPAKVYADRIPDQRGVDHGDYLPGDGPAPNRNQASAARFANDIVAGRTPVFT